MESNTQPISLSPLPIKKEVQQILQQTLQRHPLLKPAQTDIEAAYQLLHQCYENAKKLLICGNGGSAADSEHIVGELMKSFVFKRVLPDEIKQKLIAVDTNRGGYLAQKIQPALRSIALTSHTALNTAFSNDVDSKLAFAQQVMGYGDTGDVLLGISTSGNAENVVNALITAKVIGLKTIGLTGKSGGKLRDYCDVVIGVEGTDTAEIQELHLPVYHALCKMLELHFFGE